MRVIGDRYALVVELGRGAMGVVWRAEDQLLRRTLAIKELLPQPGTSDEERRVAEERVLREARSAAKLNDPAVVTVHDVLIEGDRTYLVMELVDAVNLSTLISRFGPRDPRWVADIALQALGALESAHAAGIVHRDVKPSNIMVRPDGRVTLTDFGIAQAMDDPKLTTNGMLGSPAYMSPDRLQGRPASPASDLWALGVTMAHAVEGISPFERDSTASTLHAVMYEPPVLRRASPELAEVIRGLLTVDPLARLTAAQARAMLTRIVQGAPAQPNVAQPNVAPPNVAPAHVVPAQRKRTGIQLAVAALSAVVLAAGAFAGYYVLNRPAAAQPTAAQQGPTLPTWSEDTASQAVGTALPARRIATFGRAGDIPGWGLADNECAPEFLMQGKPVLKAVSCDKQHSIQLFAASTPFWDKPQPVPFPGGRWLVDYAKKFCDEQFVSMSKQSSEVLGYTALVPTEKEWLARNEPIAPGHQEVLCVAWKQDRSPLAGSLVRD
ncbi:serine/threonine protein kinase [Lentzea sp. NBRC 105346]|uniref:serine/threonine-protein kinase n=1 Tax=Lentzea sp. NBRC 105346 TaxID=3032205 RepID=UPI0024A16373|nr:serine/threonine-protein kinase [Lentzea sp. NBRC 105346]GLZ32212.1 serine/threonine protein kinase [Lentzea sp. NBRC 105346]